MNTIEIALALSISVVALAGTASIYFVCSLVNKISKLQAANTAQEYNQLMRREDLEGIDIVPPEPSEKLVESGETLRDRI